MIAGSVMLLRGPCQVLGSGPTGKSLSVEDAGISMRKMPPHVGSAFEYLANVFIDSMMAFPLY